MNPRILKKLTRKAEPIIISLGLTKGLERVVAGPVDGDIENTVRVDRKYRWRYRGGTISPYFNQLPGTVGYGGMSGYFDPEWWDMCAWSMLKEFLFDSFSDWDNPDESGWPECKIPRKLKRNPVAILRYARQVAAAKAGAA